MILLNNRYLKNLMKIRLKLSSSFKQLKNKNGELILVLSGRGLMALLFKFQTLGHLL